MGSFNFTCAISGHSIQPGDDLRFILLTQNPYSENTAHQATSIDDHWFLRTPPLCARYADYGRVEFTQILGNLSPDTARTIQTWVSCLNQDVVERGRGDNSVHDVSVRVDMSFEAWLEALWEDRIRVEREFNPLDWEIGDEEATALVKKAQEGGQELSMDAARRMVREQRIPIGVPTLMRIEDLIARANLGDGRTAIGSYMVDEICPGCVRVRWDGLQAPKGFGKDIEKLERVVKVLEASEVRYAFVLMAGTGAYSHSAEIQIHPRPGIKGWHGGRDKNQESLQVSFMFILESVWQALLRARYDFRREDWTPEEYKESLHAFYKKAMESHSRHRLGPIGFDREGHAPGWMIASSMPGHGIPFTMGIPEHFRSFCDFGLSLKDASSFLDSLAELAFVQDKLRALNFRWHPSTYGGQADLDQNHWKFHASMAAIARAYHFQTQKLHEE